MLQSHTLTHAQILRSSLPFPISADRGHQHCWRQYPVGVTVSSEVPRLRFRLDLPVGDDGSSNPGLGLYLPTTSCWLTHQIAGFLLKERTQMQPAEGLIITGGGGKEAPSPLRVREAANPVHLCIPSTDPFRVETCAGQPCIIRPGPQSLASTASLFTGGSSRVITEGSCEFPTGGECQQVSATR